ncbi:uncharacterized protein LOC132743278 [Ruditapes philippinarum]|uniref:uncharacterized protein LOC132743278 n=1 Tax=Ruditapes philippinarum TaxID=129788 RepID=UPI00295A65A6|nr:uncharacterized protein LOC132743278 [Ruditapes philippinarum]
MNLSKIIPLTPELRLHLKWWLQDQNILKGYYFQTRSYPHIITTDASLYGWGAHMKGYTVQGRWSASQKLMHINCLEMKAVLLAVSHFLPFVKSQNVLIRTDNTTVMQYINKQGGTKSPKLCKMSWDLWNLALENKILLRAAHVKGKQNCLADLLSRKEIRDSEWSLKDCFLQKIFNLWGHPLMDLFATEKNKKTMLFCTWIPSQYAYATDALSVAWQNMFAYAFPPIQLIPKVLSHMKQYKCTVILIAPFWPRQQWFPTLLSMLVANPLQLPCSPDLLSQCQGKVLHPEPEKLNLAAWMLSTECGRQRDFLKKLESCSNHLGVWEQEKTIVPNLNNFVVGVLHNKLIHMNHL